MDKRIHRNRHPTTMLEGLDNIELRKLAKVLYVKKEVINPKPDEAYEPRLEINQYKREGITMVIAGFLIIVGLVFFAAHMPVIAFVFGGVGILVALAR